MRGMLIAVIAASFALVVFTGPRVALSMPALAAPHYGEANAGTLQLVKKNRYSRNWHGGHYYRGYAYRPYYRPYGYYRPYSYYGYPGYYRRPGFSIWFGF